MNQVAANIDVAFIADGTSTTLEFDLLSDPYENGRNTAARKLPTDVVPTTAGVTATLSKSIVTFTFATAPAAGPGDVQAYLVYG